jgi:hypothetical protein
MEKPKLPQGDEERVSYTEPPRTFQTCNNHKKCKTLITGMKLLKRKHKRKEKNHT